MEQLKALYTLWFYFVVHMGLCVPTHASGFTGMPVLACLGRPEVDVSDLPQSLLTLFFRRLLTELGVS